MYSQPTRLFRAFTGWRRGVVVSGVRRWTKLTHVGPGYYWDGWLSSGGYTISVCNKPTRSTQPCIPPRSLNWVPASAGVRAEMSPLPGVIPYGIWVPVAVWQPCELLYTCYFWLSATQFNNLLKVTGPQIEKLDTNWHRSVSPAERLATQLAKWAPSRAAFWCSNRSRGEFCALCRTVRHGTAFCVNAIVVYHVID